MWRLCVHVLGTLPVSPRFTVQAHNFFQAVHFLLSPRLEKKCVRTRQLRRRLFCCSTQSSCALVLLRVGAGAFTVHMFARTMMELSQEGRKHEQHITAQILDGLPLKA